MNDNEKLNRAFENVDDKYVMAAMQPPRRARRVWQRIGVVAACLAILIGAYFPIRNAVIMGRYQDGEVFADTEQKGTSAFIGAQSPSAPPLPWADTLYLKGEVETRSYKPDEEITLLFEVAIKNDYLGAGDLRLMLKAADFDVRFEGVTGEGNEILLADATPDKYSTAQPLKFKAILTPKYTEAFAMGTISLLIRFEPDDEQGLLDKIAESDLPNYNDNWQNAFFEQGNTLRLSLLLG